MSLRRTTARAGGAGLVAVGVLALAGCNLGVDPVTYELVDAEDGNTPLGPTGLADGDVDGDGDSDVVATGRDGYATLTNDGSGAFTLDFPRDFQPSARFPSLVDVDGDDDLDLVSSVDSLNQGSVPAVRRNDGTGAFGGLEVLQPDPTPGDLTSLTTGDADGDGDIDVLVALRIDQVRHVGVYLNDGTGAFGLPATYSLGYTSDRATPVNLVAGDLEGDGDIDVVATDNGPFTTPDGDVVDGTIAMVGLNDGTGTFTAGSPLELSRNGVIFALTPALADLDNDGNLDLAVGGSGSITTALGDGAGGFAAPQRVGVAKLDYITSADIDEDGNADIVGFEDILKATDGVVLYGDGAGGVAESHGLGTGTAPGGDGGVARQVGITDLEGDGDPDILFLAGSLGVVENATEGRRPAH